MSEHRSWYKGLLDEMVDNVLKSGVLTGVALDAAPVWMLPRKILLARVWPTTEKSKVIWVIAGEAVVPDHVPGDVAVGPREAARHFSLKWQLDAEQLYRQASERKEDDRVGIAMKAHADRLIQCANQLYDLGEQDEAWKPR